MDFRVQIYTDFHFLEKTDFQENNLAPQVRDRILFFLSNVYVLCTYSSYVIRVHVRT